MNKKAIHPLILNNEYTEDFIETIEKKYTVDEIIAWCRINVENYISETLYKNQSDENKRKIDAYSAYRESLQELLSKSQTLKRFTAKEAYKLLNIEWRYE